MGAPTAALLQSWKFWIFENCPQILISGFLPSSGEGLNLNSSISTSRYLPEPVPRCARSGIPVLFRSYSQGGARIIELIHLCNCSDMWFALHSSGSSFLSYGAEIPKNSDSKGLICFNSHHSPVLACGCQLVELVLASDRRKRPSTIIN